jgi:hypothetical protein
MKIYLSIDGTEKKGYFTATSADLTGVCEDAEATEILAPHILDFISFAQMGEFIQYLCSKLRHKGKLIVGGTEPNEVCKAFVLKSLNVQQLNEILYSGQQGVYPLSDISAILESNGLIINRKKIEGVKFVIEAARG